MERKGDIKRLIERWALNGLWPKIIAGGERMKKTGFAWLAAMLFFLAGTGLAAAGEIPLEVKVNSSIYKSFPEEKMPLKPDPGTRHWVYDELAAFKQAFVPVVHDERTTYSEKKILQEEIFNTEKLDKPIEVKNWALLLKTALKLPGEKAGQLLEMYVYGLASGKEILREDAVGGMVKLLTIDYLSGSSTPAGLEASKTLVDLRYVSEKQRTLVQMAFCEGILDATVNDFFRPKEALTNAEAVSMLYRVIKKYNIDLNEESFTGQNRPQAGYIKHHWAESAIKKSIENALAKADRFKKAEEIVRFGSADSFAAHLEKPIPVERWNDLLVTTLGLPNEKYGKDLIESYTFGLSDGKYITRGAAVAGMMKLLHVAELVKGRDATQEERVRASKRFNDYGKAMDQSKMAIAYSEGLINGYGDNSFRPGNMLTHAEALVLVARIIEKY